jgi:hypothetical protein
LQGADIDILLSEGLSRFAFWRLCPVECEAYSPMVSEKQKTKALRAPRFCGEKIIMKNL